MTTLVSDVTLFNLQLTLGEGGESTPHTTTTTSINRTVPPVPITSRNGEQHDDREEGRERETEREGGGIETAWVWSNGPMSPIMRDHGALTLSPPPPPQILSTTTTAAATC